MGVGRVWVHETGLKQESFRSGHIGFRIWSAELGRQNRDDRGSEGRALFLDRWRGLAMFSTQCGQNLNMLQLFCTSSFLQAKIQADTQSPILNSFFPNLTFCQPNLHFAEPVGLWSGFSDSGVSSVTPIPHEPLLSMVLLPYQENVLGQLMEPN